MHQHRAVLLLVAVVLPVVAGCDGDATGTSVDVTGTYALHTFDGQTPPVTLFEEEGIRIELLSGSLTLRGDGSYTEPITYRFTDLDTGETEIETFVDAGTYTRAATTLTFTSQNPEVGTYTGTASGSEVRYTLEDTIVVFRR